MTDFGPYAATLDDWAGFTTRPHVWLLLTNTYTPAPAEHGQLSEVEPHEITVAGYNRQALTSPLRIAAPPTGSYQHIRYTCAPPVFDGMAGGQVLSWMALARADDGALMGIIALPQLDSASGVTLQFDETDGELYRAHYHLAYG